MSRAGGFALVSFPVSSLRGGGDDDKDLSPTAPDSGRGAGPDTPPEITLCAECKEFYRQIYIYEQILLWGRGGSVLGSKEGFPPSKKGPNLAVLLHFQPGCKKILSLHCYNRKRMMRGRLENIPKIGLGRVLGINIVPPCLLGGMRGVGGCKLLFSCSYAPLGGRPTLPQAFSPFLSWSC